MGRAPPFSLAVALAVFPQLSSAAPRDPDPPGQDAREPERRGDGSGGRKADRSAEPEGERSDEAPPADRPRDAGPAAAAGHDGGGQAKDSPEAKEAPAHDRGEAPRAPRPGSAPARPPRPGETAPEDAPRRDVAPRVYPPSRAESDAGESAPPTAYPPAPRAAPSDIAYPPTVSSPEPVGEPAGPKMRRRTGLLVSGIVLTGVGAVGAVTGAAIVGDVEEDNDCQQHQKLLECPLPASEEQRRNTGLAVGLVGLGLIGAGIPMTVVGARPVPVEGGDLEIEATLRLGSARVKLRF